MKLNEFKNYVENCKEAQKVRDKREELQELHLKKSEAEEGANNLNRQLRELYNEAIRTDNDEVYQEIQTIKGRLEITEEEPGQYDEAIKEVEEELQTAEKKYFEVVENKANETALPFCEKWIELMEKHLQLKKEFEKIGKIAKKAIPQQSNQERLQAIYLSPPAIREPKPLRTVRSELIERYNKRCKEKLI